MDGNCKLGVFLMCLDGLLANFVDIVIKCVVLVILNHITIVYPSTCVFPSETESLLSVWRLEWAGKWDSRTKQNKQKQPTAWDSQEKQLNNWKL